MGVGLVCLRKGKVCGWVVWLGGECKGKMIVEEVGMDEVLKDFIGYGKNFGFFCFE